MVPLTRRALTAATVLILLVSGCTGTTPHPSPSTASTTSSASPTSSSRAAGPTIGRTSIETPTGWAGTISLTPTTENPGMVAEGQAWMDQGVLIGMPFEATADTALPQEGVVITRHYPVPLSEGLTATLAFYDETAKSWRAVPSQISADRMSVSARVHHLSVWDDFIAGAQERLEELRDGVGSAVKTAADFTVDAAKGIAGWTADRISDAADWMFYAVGKVFDTRVDGPSCDSGAPRWVERIIHIENQHNNPILFCTGHDGNNPALLVVKARVNRGFAYTAQVTPKTTWRYNSTDPDGMWDAVLAWAKTDEAFRDALLNVSGGDPRLLVGAGEEFSVGFAETDVRKVPGNEVLALNPPAPPTFVLSLVGQLLMQWGMLKDESRVSAALLMAGCLKEISAANTNDALSVAKSALTCITARDEDLGHLVAQGLSSAGLTPKMAGGAAGIVARASVYLALIGPTFSAMNYYGETQLPVSSRNVSIHSKQRKPTQIINLNIFDATGKLKPDYIVDDRRSTSEPLLCWETESWSPVATSPGTHRCGANADSAFACWPADSGSSDILCLTNPWTSAVVRWATRGLTDTPAPVDPQPFGIELTDGSLWWYRNGGSWGVTPEGTYGIYGPQDGREGTVLLAKYDQPTFKVEDGVWSVLLGKMGDGPAENMPPPTWEPIAKIWYITTT